MAAVDERTVAVQAWSAQEIAAAIAVAENVQRAALSDWTRFVDWYAAAATLQQAKHTADLVAAARDTAAHIGASYMSEVLSALGAGPVRDTKLAVPPARLGADLTQVYTRPAATYRRTFALTGSLEEATAAMQERLTTMVADDLMVARRDGEQEIMQRADVKGWRRILHPELARDGSCGLCIAAAHQEYRTSTLRAVHGRCNCSVAPIVGEFDPKVVNDTDLAAAYDAAGGSNKGADLKRTRFKINEHGELGPVLTDAAHYFQGPGDRDNVNSIARARRRLEDASRVLTELEGSDDNPDALHYQRKFVTHLRSMVDQAA